MKVTVELDATLLHRRQHGWAHGLAHPQNNPLLPGGTMLGGEVTLENEWCVYTQDSRHSEGLPHSGLIVTKRPCQTVFDLTPAEASAIHELLAEVRAHLEKTVKPDGYTVGWNVFPAGGAHIPHVHLHVIPRWNADVLAGAGLRYFLKAAAQAAERRQADDAAPASALHPPEVPPMIPTRIPDAHPSLSQMHVKLRQATPSDFPTVLTLLEGCGLHTQSVTPEGSTYWIADLDGVPGGCIGLEHGEGVSLIRSTAVLPTARSQGLGRALVTSALTHASLRGDRAVYLFSQEAGDYWQRFGFGPVGVDEISAALPDTPQIKSGLLKGWIHGEQAWKRELNTGRQK